MIEKLKADLRIPTNEQYAYIELKAEGTIEEIINTYIEATELYKKKAEEANNNKTPF